MRTNVINLLIALLFCFNQAGTAKGNRDGKIIIVDGICYAIKDGKAEVVAPELGTKYSGDIIIPAEIKNEGVVCKVVAICAEAFANCEDVTSISLPNTILRIGTRAFNRCYGLRTLGIPKSVQSIEEEAFLWCKNLRKVQIPKYIESIAATAFYCCHGLEAENGIRYAGPMLVEVEDKERSKYVIRKGTRWIGANAMSNLPKVESVVVPNSVESIGPFAFCCNSKLKSVDIKNGTRVIESGAFSSCTALESLTLPNTLEQVSYDILVDCNRLRELRCKSVQVPKITHMNNDVEAFYRFNPTECKLIVPKESIDGYVNNRSWGKGKFRIIHL